MRPTDFPTGTHGSRQRLLLTLGAATTLLVASIGAVSFSAAQSFSAAPSASVAEAQKVVIEVLHAEHELTNLPATAAQTGVGASLRGRMVAAAKSEIDRLYSGPIVAARVETLVAGIEVEGTPDGIFVWDGGVRNIVFESTVVGGDSATVRVQATTFLVMSATAEGDRSSPTNTGTFTFKLSRIGGTWHVTDEDVAFAPGEGP